MMITRDSGNFRRASLALGLGSFMVFANLYLIQPLLPTLMDNFAITELQANWSFSLTTLMLGLSLVVYGPLSDAMGRKNIMLASMAGVVMFTFLLSQVQDYHSMLVLRALQGLCLGGLPAIAIAYMGDEFEHHAMIAGVGIYIAANSLGGIGGRLIGGFAGEWLGWSEAFGVMSVLSLLLVIVFAWLLPPSTRFVAKPSSPSSIFNHFLQHLTNPLLLLAYLIGGFNFFIFLNQYSFVTFRLAAAPYSLSSSWLGMLFLTYLAGTFGSLLSGRVARRFSQPICMICGIALLVTGSLVTLLPSLWMIITGLMINAFGFFFTHSAASSWISRHAHQAKASASSLYLLFYYVGASSGGFYLQPFWQSAGWRGVIAGSLIILALTSLFAVILYRISREPLPLSQAV